jgi:hypothetical protein
VTHYAACGLTLAADAPIAGLGVVPGDRPADLTVGFHAGKPVPAMDAADVPWYVSPDRDDRGSPLLVALTRTSDGGRWLRYSEGAAFCLDAEARRVDAWWQPPLIDADAATYLLGPVLAFAMRMRGLVPLHASGVAVDGRAVLFAGTPGAGKSTTAAAFAALGYPVLSDDVVPLACAGAELTAWPGHPRVSLWADAADAVFGGVSPLPAYSETYAKRYLDLDGSRLPFQRGPLPVGAVFVLDGEESPMAPLAPREAVVALLQHTYGTYLIDMELRAREFDLLARLVAEVPVWRLRWGTELGDVMRRCLALAEHVRHTIYGRVGRDAALPV